MKSKLWAILLLPVIGFAIGYLSGKRISVGIAAPPNALLSTRLTSGQSTSGRATHNGAAHQTDLAAPSRISLQTLFGPPLDTPTPEPPPAVYTQRPTFVPNPPEDTLQRFSYTGSAVFGEDVYATVMDEQTKEETMLRPGDQLLGYTVAAIRPDAITLTAGSSTRRLTVVDRFNPVPMMVSTPKDVLPNPGNLAGFRDKTYQSFFFQVTGAATGTIWGSAGTYTDDSELATAAVHAGVLKAGESGVVRVTVLPGYDHYDGAASNGIVSNSYAEWQGSFRVGRL